MTLGEAATLDTGDADGLRGGGGAEACGTTPRDDGGGGIRDVGVTLPYGRGTTLTGRGGTTDGGTIDGGTTDGGTTDGGTTDGAGLTSAGELLTLRSFSSPIEPEHGASTAPRPDSTRKAPYSRTIS
jgi:hypothetical protein